MRFIKDLIDYHLGKHLPDFTLPGTIQVRANKYHVDQYRPKGDDYRVARYQDGRLGLQSFKGGEWVDMEFWDDGYDDYGKLHEAQFKPMRQRCMWDMDSLRRLREKLMGIELDPVPVSWEQ